MNMLYDGRLTCIATDSDLEIGDLVDFQEPTSQTVHPLAVKTAIGGRLMGVCMTNAEEDEQVMVRLFTAGTLSVKCDVTSGTLEPGNPVWVGAGELLEDPGLQNADEFVGTMAATDNVVTGQDGARVEILILKNTPSEIV